MNRRSDVRFEGEGVAIGILEPGDTTATGTGGDPFGIGLECVVAGELDARRDEEA